METYSNFHELIKNEEEGVDYKREIREESWRNQDIAIIAPHGGKIEPYTSLIASNIAGEDYLLYKFEGIKLTENFQNLHITSTRFDDPKCLELLGRVQTAITIHGMDRDARDVLIGGLHGKLIGLIEHQLQANGFDATVDTKCIVPGTSRENICNQTRSKAGVQLEINKGLRHFLGDNETYCSRFCNCIRNGIEEYLSDST